MKQGKLKRMIVGGNTADGYISFAAENLRDCERVFMLMGAVGCGKSSLILRVAQSMQERGLDVELWQATGVLANAEVVVIPELAAAVVDAGFMEHIHPESLGVVEEVYNFAEYWDEDLIRRNHREIKRLQALVKENMLSEAGLLTVLSENQPRRYAAAGIRLSEEELEEIAAGLAAEIFNKSRVRVRHFLASVWGADGVVSFVQEVSEDCERRFLLCGEVDFLLERLLQAAVERGLSADLYYDPLNTSRLQAVILPQLSIAVLDAELEGLEPRYNDEVFVCCQAEENDAVTDEPSVAAEVRAAALCGEENTRRLAAYYTAAMDFERLDDVCSEILAKLWQMARERGC